jgi:hypothetical protein
MLNSSDVFFAKDLNPEISMDRRCITFHCSMNAQTQQHIDMLLPPPFLIKSMPRRFLFRFLF